MILWYHRYYMTVSTHTQLTVSWTDRVLFNWSLLPMLTLLVQLNFASNADASSTIHSSASLYEHLFERASNHVNIRHQRHHHYIEHYNTSHSQWTTSSPTHPTHCDIAYTRIHMIHIYHINERNTQSNDQSLQSWRRNEILTPYCFPCHTYNRSIERTINQLSHW